VREAHRGGVLQRHGPVYGFKNRFQVSINIMIAETQNGEPRFGKVSIANPVVLDLGIEPVLVPISFNNQLGFQAGKIEYVPVARNLPPEMDAALPP
jgi:hypothetical protein